MIDRSRIKRDHVTAQAIFTTLLKSASHLLQAGEITATTGKKLQTQLEAAFSECKQTNSVLLDLLPRKTAEAEIEWIPNLQGRYSEIAEQLEIQIDKQEPKSERKHAIEQRSNNLRMEKIRLPRFEGEIREYPQFKKDFQKLDPP